MQTKTIARLSRKAQALAALLLGVTGFYPVHALAANSPDLPLPGLYQIDKESTMVLPASGTTIRQRDDGASGDMVNNASVGGHSNGERAFKGTGPRTQCITKQFTNALPSTVPGQNCKSQDGTQTKDGFVYKTICPSGVSTFSTRRIDGKTWELTTTTSISAQAPGTAPDMSGLRAILAVNAKNGASAEELGKITGLMTTLTEAQREMPSVTSKAAAQLNVLEAQTASTAEKEKIRAAKQVLNGTKPSIEAVDKERWTRIADSCGATQRAISRRW